MNISQRIEAPDFLPVSLEEIKRHLVIQHNEDDLLLEQYIGAATNHLDGHDGLLGCFIVKQKWSFKFEPGDTLLINLPGARNIVVSELIGDDYQIIHKDFSVVDLADKTKIIKINASPIHQLPIKITADFGYEEVSLIPDDLKLAIVMLASYFYENRSKDGRQNMSDLMNVIKMLISNHRGARI